MLIDLLIDCNNCLFKIRVAVFHYFVMFAINVGACFEIMGEGVTVFKGRVQRKY